MAFPSDEHHLTFAGFKVKTKLSPNLRFHPMGLHVLFTDLLLKKQCICRRWSPRGRPCPREHILKFLAVASKPQVLENCPFLGSRTALFFEQLKFFWKTPETSRKICEYLLCFLLLEHRRSQEGETAVVLRLKLKIFEISPMTKM